MARLEAAKELVLRQFQAELQGKTILSGSAEAKQYLQARYGGDPHESFVCVYLNNKHHVVNIEVLFRGTIDGAPVYPREVVKRYLYFNAAAVIFAHNYPSGVAEPSEADITVTR
ncbi:MAG: JAB domain-containing protein [Pseudohongiellaceae bacterium]